MIDKLIYDFGMNNGDDVEYYLKKGYRVVGVEANPQLCSACAVRFKNAIDEGRFILENVAVSNQTSSHLLSFYIHKSSHVSSSLVKPSDIENYRTIEIRQRSATDIIREYGEPFYVKIDVEYYDVELLKNLLTGGIRAHFISAEAHDINVFAALCLLGYRYFNLVEGEGVSQMYGNTTIQTESGQKHYSFPRHSAGPFGEDIKTPWMTKEVFGQFLLTRGLGWKDIHATNELSGNSVLVEKFDQIPLSPRQNLDRLGAAIPALIDLMPSIVRRYQRKRSQLRNEQKGDGRINR